MPPLAPFVTIGEEFDRLQTYFAQGETPKRIRVQLRANKTYPKGQILCPVTATPGLYDAPGAAGVGSAELILEYPAATDANGKITRGAAVDANGPKFDDVPAYATGNFKCSDLTGQGVDLLILNKLGVVKAGDQTTGILFMFGC